MSKKRTSVRRKKKMGKKKSKIMIKESINEKQKKAINTKISKRRRARNIARKVASKSSSNQSSFTLSNNYQEKKAVLLPKDLLEKAQALIETDITKAIEIYDIDDNINYNYLIKCGKIDKSNEKYIYTLSFKNRKKIVNKFNIQRKIYKKKSKEFFKEFVQYLINNFSHESSLNSLNNYKLYNFGRFIIYINEGTEELKYYYFIDLIFKWLTKKNTDAVSSKEKTIDCLSYFEDFF